MGRLNTSSTHVVLMIPLKVYSSEESHQPTSLLLLNVYKHFCFPCYIVVLHAVFRMPAGYHSLDPTAGLCSQFGACVALFGLCGSMHQGFSGERNL